MSPNQQKDHRCARWWLVISHQDIRNDLSHRVRRVVLSVLPPTIFVVVLDHVLKESREKVKTLWKDSFIKLDACKEIDDGLCHLVRLLLSEMVSESNVHQRDEWLCRHLYAQKRYRYCQWRFGWEYFQKFHRKSLRFADGGDFDQLVWLEPSCAGTDILQEPVIVFLTHSQQVFIGVGLI